MIKTIMIVDDEKAILGLFCKYFVEDYKIICHSDPIKVSYWDIISANIVIVDYTLPHMNGLRLAEKIKRIKDVPIILHSGNTEYIDYSQCSVLPVDDILSKPVTLKKLGEVVKKHLDLNLGEEDVYCFPRS